LLLPLRAGAWRALPASVLPYTFLWALLVAALVGLGPKVGKVGRHLFRYQDSSEGHM